MPAKQIGQCKQQNMIFTSYRHLERLRACGDNLLQRWYEQFLRTLNYVNNNGMALQFSAQLIDLIILVLLSLWPSSWPVRAVYNDQLYTQILLRVTITKVQCLNVVFFCQCYVLHYPLGIDCSKTLFLLNTGGFQLHKNPLQHVIFNAEKIASSMTIHLIMQTFYSRPAFAEPPTAYLNFLFAFAELGRKHPYCN